MGEKTVVQDKQLNAANVFVILVCWLTIIFEGYDLLVYGTVVPALLQYKPWNLNLTTIGAVGGLVAIGMLVGSLVIGTLTDFIGRKYVFVGCLSIFALAMGLCGSAPTLFYFGLFRFVAGLGLGGTLPTLTAIAVEYAPARWRTFTYSLIFTGIFIGGILAASLAIPLIPAFGWRVMFWISAIPLVVVLPVALFMPESVSFLLAKKRRAEAEVIARRFHITLPPETETVVVSNIPTRKFGNVATLFSSRYIVSTLAFWVSTFMALFMIFGLNTWLPTIMTNAGYSLGSALSFVLVLNIGNIVTSIITGILCEKYGSKRVCITAFSLSAVAFFLLLFKEPLLAVYGLFVIAGLGSFCIQQLLNSYVARFYPLQSRATAVGWQLGAGRFAAILAPNLLGWLTVWHLGYQWSFYIFIAASLLGALALFFVKDSHSAEQPYIEHITEPQSIVEGAVVLAE